MSRKVVKSEEKPEFIGICSNLKTFFLSILYHRAPDVGRMVTCAPPPPPSPAGTSNWSGDYFVNTGGIGLVVNSSGDGAADSVRSQLAAVFLRDWQSEYSRPLDDAPAGRR